MNKESKEERLQREWERQVEQYAVQKQQRQNAASSRQLPPQVEVIRQEAEMLVNEQLAAQEMSKATHSQPFSVQAPSTDTPSEFGSGLIWWTGGTIDQYIPLADYGDPHRVDDLRAFALVSPFILAAEGVLTKKVQALQWSIEGGRNLAYQWQEKLNNFENGDGWDYFVARWIRAYSESDKAAVVEIIRAAPKWAIDENYQLTPRGVAAVAQGKDKMWEIVDARVMDPTCIFPTTSREFPIIYRNKFTGMRHRLRPHQFMSIVDQPSVDDHYPLTGVCAVSRAVWAAQEDRMIIRYAMERMSENPGAGIGVINASVTALQSALKAAKAEREARGVVYYKGVIFLPVLNPTGTTKMEFLSFANLPEGFDRGMIYQELKERVATAFGLDVLELGSISGRQGTATQAKVMAQKGRVRTIGAIMQAIERSFRYKLLPPSIKFNIKKRDQDEEMLRAEIDQIYFENAIRYAQFTDPIVAQQYLVDKGAVPNESPYIDVDQTPLQITADTDAPERVEGSRERPEEIIQGPVGTSDDGTLKRLKREGPRVRVDRDGAMTYLEPTYRMAQMRWMRKMQPGLQQPNTPLILEQDILR